MGEPRSISYKDVKQAFGDGAKDVWTKIGEVTGAGHVPINADGEAFIDLTGASEAKQSQVDNLLAKSEPEKKAKENK
jgi:hypothetical protein